MAQFKTVNSTSDISYISKNTSIDIEKNYADKDEYEYECQNEKEIKTFTQLMKDTFVKEYMLQSDIEKQAEYSKSNGHLISLILVTHTYGDGEFCGHRIQSTCLINENNQIYDQNNLCDIGGEYAYYIKHAYHVLPDQKLIEILFENPYVSELTNIFNTITKIRQYYYLNKNINLKEDLEDNPKKNKI